MGNNAKKYEQDESSECHGRDGDVTVLEEVALGAGNSSRYGRAGYQWRATKLDVGVVESKNSADNGERERGEPSGSIFFPSG